MDTTTKTTSPLTAAGSLFAAAVAADVAWSAALKEAFGKAAGDRRYDSDQSSHPEACKVAYAAFRQANDAWLTYMREARK